MLTGDSISVGINFLAKGHLPMIQNTMLSEKRNDKRNDKFPHLAEMIALLLKESLTKVTPMSCPNILNLYSSVNSLYEEDSVREVCCFFLNF